MSVRYSKLILSICSFSQEILQPDRETEKKVRKIVESEFLSCEFVKYDMLVIREYPFHSAPNKSQVL